MTNSTRDAIGTCDDCGAENVRIWQTEYNWQCVACVADDNAVSPPPAAGETQSVLHVGTDRYGRAWRVLDRDDSFSVYYTTPDSLAHHVIYDSRDEYNDPPRVLLGRAQEAERKVAALQAERDRRRAALENIARQSAETRPPHTSPAFYARRVLDALREGGE